MNNTQVILSVLSVLGLLYGGVQMHGSLNNEIQNASPKDYIDTIATKEAPSAIGPYSQGKILKNQGLIFASGQIGVDPNSGEIKGDHVYPQTIQAFNNIKAILEAGGSSLDYVFKTTVFLQDIKDFKEMNEAYKLFFGAELPARSCVEVANLPKPGALVEIEVMAIKPQ